MATFSSILAWRIPWTDDPGSCPWVHKESDMTEWLPIFTFMENPYLQGIFFFFPSGEVDL